MNISEQRVREFAHQIWESEGRPDGQASRHWEMACKLAESGDTSQSQQTAPQHKTVLQNDTDMINKSGKAKSKALKKSVAETDSGFKRVAQPGFEPDTRSLSAPQASAANEPARAPKKIAAAKAGSETTSRSKKAKLLKDTVDTEIPKI